MGGNMMYREGRTALHVPDLTLGTGTDRSMGGARQTRQTGQTRPDLAQGVFTSK